jgi:glycosyltransferase involved in cell wall biosynthesis
VRIALSASLMHSGHDYRAAGVSVYTENLIRALLAHHSEHEWVAFAGRDAPVVSGLRVIASPFPVHSPMTRIPWEQVILPALASVVRPDVLHATVNVLPLAAPGASVVTIHDLAFLRHPERFASAKVAYLRAAVPASVKKAKHIIAVSQHTRHDLVDLLHVPPERISVVYSGVHADFRPFPDTDRQRARRRFSGGRPYILHVGTLEPRKNLDVLIRAYANLRETLDVPHVLVLAGGAGWMFQNLYDLVVTLGVQDHVQFAGYVLPSDLPHLYNGADLFVYPSAYEGFGLPVLEAMACGVPVITSVSSALTELAGDACLTVTPGKHDELLPAMARVLEDRQLSACLRKAGIRRAGGFTWRSTAQGTMAVYHCVREESR